MDTKQGFQQGAFHSYIRPSAGWIGVIALLACTVFVGVVLWSIAACYLQTVAKGQPPPDMTGGLGPIILGLAPIVAGFAQFMHLRGGERRMEIARGDVPSPFSPSPGDSP